MPPPGWLSDRELRAPAPLRLALFGNDLLAAVQRCPRTIQGMHSCFSDRLERLNAQLVICQLPRVDERVLAMLWLLAESWGQVTSSGVRLPLTLTHETVGALVGARRPTVTLALRKLTRQGSILHQDTGWLLLDPPPEPTQRNPHDHPTRADETIDLPLGAARPAGARSERDLCRAQGNGRPFTRAACP